MFDVLDDLEAAVEKLAADEGVVDVVRICELAERLEFQRLRAIGEFDRSGAWAADGFVSTASALRSKTALFARARAQVRPPGPEARVTCPRPRPRSVPVRSPREHVAEIAGPYTPARAEMLEGIEAELVAFAKISTPDRAARRGQGHVRRVRRRRAAPAPTRSNTRSTRSRSRNLRRAGDPERVARPRAHRPRAHRAGRRDGQLRATGETRKTPELRSAALESICRQYLAVPR